MSDTDKEDSYSGKKFKEGYRKALSKLVSEVLKEGGFR
tara:strand:- start:42 stop:155 length:114 start_codon:yes stop_codon:yes gene_type:complete